MKVKLQELDAEEFPDHDDGTYDSDFDADDDFWSYDDVRVALIENCADLHAGALAWAASAYVDALHAVVVSGRDAIIVNAAEGTEVGSMQRDDLLGAWSSEDTKFRAKLAL